MRDIVQETSALRNLGWSWTRIAAHYRVSEREVRRWVNTGNPHDTVVLPHPDRDLPEAPLVLTYAPVLVVNDAQYPHHDPAVWEVTCQIARDAEVEEIVWAGDMLDFEQLSSYVFDPHKTDKAKTDVEGFHRDLRKPLLDAVKPVLGYKPEEHWVDGNHEHRYWKYCHKHSALDDPDPVDFMELYEMQSYYPYGSRIGHYLTPELAVIHGWSTAKTAVQQHVNEMGCSVIHGHTHRISSWHKLTGTRHLVGHEVGHMTVPTKVPGYHEQGRPDWQLVAGTLVRKSRHGDSFSVQPLPVFGDNEDRVMANDRLYRIER